jgi:hypothetical protein
MCTQQPTEASNSHGTCPHNGQETDRLAVLSLLSQSDPTWWGLSQLRFLFIVQYKKHFHLEMLTTF